MIDERAIVHPTARIGANVEIGPWTLIGPNVDIGDGCWIGPHVVINGRTKIGSFNKIYQFASVGEDPQDKKYQGEDTCLEIGDHNIIREYCTINRGTAPGGGITKIGNNNLFMAYVHIAHDCAIGNNNILANNTSLAGHVVIYDNVNLGGFTGVAQFCRIGSFSFVGKAALVTKDIPPFLLIAGPEPTAAGLNVVGLRRHGFAAETVAGLKRAYKLIFRQGLLLKDVLEKLDELLVGTPEVKLFIDFIRDSERGIIR